MNAVIATPCNWELCSAMPKKRIALMGASGLVGQRFCQLLADHPYFDEPVLYGWRNSGRKLSEILKVAPETVSDTLLEQKLGPINTADILREGYDVIFSAIPSSLDSNIEMELAKGGARIFTNSGMNRMNPDVPIIVPEVNDSHFSLVEGRDGFIVANGNCSSIGLALPLKPLLKFNPEHVEVTSMQALSGAGYPGVPSLDAVSNLVPYIDSEEEKIMREVPKILGIPVKNGIESAGIKIDATCTRIPVREGHTESIAVTFEDNPDLEKVRKAFSEFRAKPQELSLPTAPPNPVILEDSPDRPQPAIDLWRGKGRSMGMAVTVGRLRVKENQARFVTLSHNTVRGAAGGSVLNAELAYSRGIL